MRIHIDPDAAAMGRRGAEYVAKHLGRALAERGAANLIVATGASQFTLLEHLVKADLDWSKVTAFHLDEYVGMDDTHPASFVKYLRERFEQKLPKPLAAFHYVNGAAADPAAECARLGELVRRHPVDVACVGIGENSHLAFNDPPADFDTEEPYLIVNLDDACRRQQMGEGWFKTLDDVPAQAISMSIRQILKSSCIVCSVPDARKAPAVKATVEGELSATIPASVLRAHGRCLLLLDEPAAAGLSPVARAAAHA